MVIIEIKFIFKILFSYYDVMVNHLIIEVGITIVVFVFVMHGKSKITY